MIHYLKTWPEYFAAVLSGEKPFELRKNDREFAKGDILVLQEYCPQTDLLTGRQVTQVVTYLLPGGEFGIDPEYVVMGIKRVHDSCLGGSCPFDYSPDYRVIKDFPRPTGEKPERSFVYRVVLFHQGLEGN